MKTWSKTKNGLRFHYPSKTYYVNATVNGRNWQKSTGTNVEKDALAFRDEFLSSLRAGGDEQAIKLKAGLTLATYIAQARRLFTLEKVGPRTLERKQNEIKYIEKRWQEFRNRPLADEDPRAWTIVELLEFQQFLAQHYAPAVVNCLICALINVLELVEEQIKGFRSPHRSNRFEPLPRGDKAKVVLPTEAQFAAVIAWVRNERANAFRDNTADLVEGLAYSNLRINEAARLRVEHVNLDGACLDLPPEIVKGKRKGRRVPLGAKALELFRRLVEQAGSSGRVFKCPKANSALKRACAAIGCPALTHHKLRHWWATIALERTGDAKQVSEWLGHRDGGKLVLQTYTHTRSEREKLLAEKLNFDWSAKTEAA